MNNNQENKFHTWHLFVHVFTSIDNSKFRENTFFLILDLFLEFAKPFFIIILLIYLL